MKKLMKTIIAFTLIIVVLGVYVTYVERNLLVVKEKEVTLIENASKKVKLVQITDTQLGEFYSLEQLEKVVNKINKIDADIVVFTGDLIDNASKYDEVNKVSQVLSKINCKIGKYAIYGNHDYGGGGVRYYEKIMKESGFIVLKNESARVKVNNKIINILGADDGLLGNHSVKKTVKGIKDSEVNILLIHEPDLIDKYERYPINLALSGHSHGGQVYIPFYGPIKKTTLAQKYTKGFYDLRNEEKTKLYVNTGLGNTKVPFRFFNIPEITLFNLEI